MFLAPKLGLTLGAVALGLLALPAAQAQTTPAFYSGTFQQDDNHNKPYTFEVTTFGTVNLYTTSYAGGSNVDGSLTAAGGFDPIISLFDSTGAYIDEVDDSPIGNADPKTGSIYDAGLQADLPPGTYQAVISEYDNFSLTGANLSDGFANDGMGNFTTMQFGTPDQMAAGTAFIDHNHDARTSFYNLNITNGAFPTGQPVPEASTTVSLGLLLALGLGGAVVAARKKARASAA